MINNVIQYDKKFGQPWFNFSVLKTTNLIPFFPFYLILLYKKSERNLCLVAKHRFYKKTFDTKICYSFQNFEIFL